MDLSHAKNTKRHFLLGSAGLFISGYIALVVGIYIGIS